MHYRHIYHAGNFADVFKHVLLVALLQALSRKDKPWCYLDTHAGAGIYDLAQGEAARTGEWRDGIGRLWGSAPEDPILARYLDAIRDINPSADLPRRYPGSPWLATQLARPADRLVVCERVPAIAKTLSEVLPAAELHLRDGYETHALLPPREKRGLVLVDPPFERADEFDAAADFLQRAGARFAGGIYALWYPLKNRHAAGRCVRRLARDASQPVLELRIDNKARAEGQMHACGLAVINPPFGFEPAARSTLQELGVRLGAHTEVIAV